MATQETFQVPDVHCGHCKGSIEGALSPMEGVTGAFVDLESRTVKVTYEESRIDRESVVRTIEGAGYPVTKE